MRRMGWVGLFALIFIPWMAKAESVLNVNYPSGAQDQRVVTWAEVIRQTDEAGNKFYYVQVTTEGHLEGGKPVFDQEFIARSEVTRSWIEAHKLVYKLFRSGIKINCEIDNENDCVFKLP